MKSSENQTYVSMMADSLQKKKGILFSIYDMTKEQADLLTSEDMDVDRFSETLEEKGSLIDELNSLDAGFDSLYKKLESELMGNQQTYADEIARMKDLIADITDFGTQIQVLEKKNHERFQQFMKSERLRIREARNQQQTVQTYVQNMVGAHKPGNSYFVNETK